MKRLVAWVGSGFCLLGLVLVVSAALGGQLSVFTENSRTADEPDPRCTNASMIGTYGFFRTGTTADGPLAAVGISRNDGNGSFRATQTISRNGKFNQVSFDGTYEVNSDCSGRLLTRDRGVTGYFVLVDGGNEVFMLSASAGNSVTGISKRITREYRAAKSGDQRVQP